MTKEVMDYLVGVSIRQSYERTWWYHRTTDKLRDLQLDRILK
jgi:hypothetical protein